MQATGNRIYVGNLAWTVEWQELKDYMRTVGKVVHADVLQDADGRSKVSSGIKRSSSSSLKLIYFCLRWFPTLFFNRSCIMFRVRESFPQGCGIVEYEDSRSANRAIRELNNTPLGGRPIFVREDREQASSRQGRRGGGGGGGGGAQSNGGGGGGGGGANVAGRQLYVGNLSFETTWADLKVPYTCYSIIIDA